MKSRSTAYRDGDVTLMGYTNVPADQERWVVIRKTGSIRPGWVHMGEDDALGYFDDDITTWTALDRDPTCLLIKGGVVLPTEWL